MHDAAEDVAGRLSFCLIRKNKINAQPKKTQGLDI